MTHDNVHPAKVALQTGFLGPRFKQYYLQNNGSFWKGAASNLQIVTVFLSEASPSCSTCPLHPGPALLPDKQGAGSRGGENSTGFPEPGDQIWPLSV